MACDFQAIYRIRVDPDTGDLAGLTGPQFLRYATRLPAYDGAVAARIVALRDQGGNDTAPASRPDAASQIEATPLNLTTHPLLREFIEYSRAAPEPPETR